MNGKAIFLLTKVVLAAAVVGCGNSDSKDDDDNVSGNDIDTDIDSDVDGDTDTDVDAAADGEGVVCADHNGFDGNLEISSWADDFIEYRFFGGEDAPYRVLRVQIFEDNIGSVGPGVYELKGSNFSDCEVCVTVLDGCAAGPCDQIFYPESGTIEITSLGREGDRFQATLRNVVMKEVDVDNETTESTPIPNGQDWCIGNYSYDVVLGDPHEAVCARPTFACVGETVWDFSLQNCASGEMVSMSSLASGQNALWFLMVSGWCSYCRERVPEVVLYDDQNALRGLEVVYVFGENAADEEPTLDQCQQYAARYTDPSRFYIDHNGTFSFSETMYNMWPYVVDADEFGLPWETVLNAQTFEYVYTNQGPGSGDLDSELGKLLGP